MGNALDVRLQDDEQFDEIQLLGELMVLASESLEALDVTTIDATLGLELHVPDQRRAS